tara:strand:- start:204 stop:914 length:711 start_codon:yes stop_codon:yes gene_type:complete
MIVACWSGPRNISTALMRSWSSRKDTFVTDEPFYAFYLRKTKLKHPMYMEILDHYDSDYDKVSKYLTSKIPMNKKIWYQKHMSHHLLDLKSIDWIKKCKNCFLLRRPEEVISSYTAKNKLSNVEELGYVQQYEIAKFLKRNNHSFIVIDSGELLDNPKISLKHWCNTLKISFDKSMLSWDQGHYPQDGIWWKHWYDNVINTNGFKKFKKKDISIENKYDSIYNESIKYYNFLKELK